MDFTKVLLGIGITISMLIYYTFETLFFVGVIYIIMLPVSYIHYRHLKKKTELINKSEEETEDIL